MEGLVKDMKAKDVLRVFTAVCLSATGLAFIVLAAMMLRMPKTAYDGDLI